MIQQKSKYQDLVKKRNAILIGAAKVLGVGAVTGGTLKLFKE